MSIETDLPSINPQQEDYACNFIIRCYDPRTNKSETLPEVQVHLEFDRKVWDKDTGEQIHQEGLGGTDRVFGMETALKTYQYTDPRTGLTTEVCGIVVDQVLRQYADEILVEYLATLEAAKNPAPINVLPGDAINGVDEGNSM